MDDRMWVANIYFERKRGLDTEQVTFGRIWHNGERGFVGLSGFRYGQFAALPFPGLDPPYISGDLIVYGPLRDDMSRNEQWCGFIMTHTNATGQSMFTGVLEVDPSPMVFARRQEKTETGEFRYGVTLSIRE